MMQVITVTIAEAQERLAELIARVAEGDSVVITEGGRSVARLSKPPLFPFIADEVANTERGRLELIRQVVESHDRDGSKLPADHPLRVLLDQGAQE